MNSISATQKHVLLVDDDESVVSTAQDMLESYLGCKVTALTNSVEALEVFRTKPDHFDLVITDIIMPKMTGEILAKELIAIRPDIPVILCTAYREGLVKHRAEAMGGAFLIKPFDLYELSKTVRKVLNKD
jgi:DNA-binding NtrC family response regulator